MGITNVLIQHKPAYEALKAAAAVVQLTPEQVAIRYLADLLLRNRYESDEEEYEKQKTLILQAQHILTAMKRLLPLTGGQFVETFDVDFEYGDFYLGPNLRANIMLWEHEITEMISEAFDSSMNDVAMAAMIYLGNQILDDNA